MTITGIGGVMFRAKDPDALSAWYREHLGIGRLDWEQQAGPTVFSPSATGTEYFGRQSQQFLLNFRVDDLDRMLEKLKAGDVTIAKEVEEHEGVGRFAWIEDLEGNRIELWEPEPDA
jgi:glyoxylase I family protein